VSRWTVGLVFAAGPLEELIQHQQRRLGQVERGIGRVGRNRRDHVTLRRGPHCSARSPAPENEGDLLVASRGLDHPLDDLLKRQRIALDALVPAGEPDDQVPIRDPPPASDSNCSVASTMCCV